jgi:hypothetical protein
VLKSLQNEKLAKEGYVYVSYGHPKYLKHTLASVTSLRRHDTKRPVALLCSQKQKDILEEKGLSSIFATIQVLPEDNCSIVGFKHNVYKFMIFERNLYLDSDIIWCKNPNSLWQSLGVFDFTITGTLVSDNFFGAAKGAGVLKDIFLGKRKRTLKKFGLSYLSRVQSGVIFARDYSQTKKVCTLASEMLDRKEETHFKSRKMEHGRSEESCEWSLAMAMSKLNNPVYPWLQGHNSAQLDYISDLTEHDEEFEYVACKYYCNDFAYSLRGLKSSTLRKLFLRILSLFPGKGDYLITTPYCLHFGWLHEKTPFYSFAESNWKQLVSGSKKGNSMSSERSENFIEKSNR